MKYVSKVNTLNSKVLLTFRILEVQTRLKVIGLLTLHGNLSNFQVSHEISALAGELKLKSFSGKGPMRLKNSGFKPGLV